MPSYLSAVVDRQAEKYGNKIALKYRDSDTAQWKPVSWNKFSEINRKAANALVALGVKEEENIGVFSQNMPECLYTEYAAFANRGVIVPLYATCSKAQVQYIVNDAAIRFLFVGEQFQYDTAFGVISYCDTLEKLIIFDRKVKKDPRDVTSVYYDEFLATGEDLPHDATVKARTERSSDEDLANILYTSGTTGEPKGVMIHHSNYMEAFRINGIRLDTVEDTDISLCFLPLVHIFEKTWCHFCVHKGIQICINKNPADVLMALQEIRPTQMCNVPRFWEKVCFGIEEKINETKGIKKALMQDAVRVGKIHNVDYLGADKTPPLSIRLKYKLYEKTVFQLLKKTLGLDKAKFFPVAGAAVAPEVYEMIRSVGIPMVFGYGLTESTATVSCAWGNYFRSDSVGKLLDDIQLKIGENDEILLKGKTMIKGYYNKPAETAAAIDEDGWFHTGDAGYFKDGELYLTERIKDLFKTSNGKYIAPQALETKLVVDRYIDQIAVVADQRKFVSALVIPVYKYIEEYAKEKKIMYTDMADLLQKAEIIELYRSRIETLQQQFMSYEQIKRFTLLPEPFSLERGELTNTLKMKRSVIAENYKGIIDKMYAGG